MALQNQNVHWKNNGNGAAFAPSTRVSAPPGGQSSLTFGCDNGNNTQPKAAFGAQKQIPEGRGSHTERSSRPVASEAAGSRQDGPSRQAKGSPSNAAPSACDVGVSRPYRSSTRINAPPGGATAFGTDWGSGAGGKSRGPEEGGAGGNQRPSDANRYYNGQSKDAYSEAGRSPPKGDQHTGASQSTRSTAARPVTAPSQLSSQAVRGHNERSEASASESIRGQNIRRSNALASQASTSWAGDSRAGPTSCAGESRIDNIPLGTDWSNFTPSILSGIKERR